MAFFLAFWSSSSGSGVAKEEEDEEEEQVEDGETKASSLKDRL